MYMCDCIDYVGFIKKVMKQMQHPQYTPMKKMEVDLRPLDAEQEKVQEGRMTGFPYLTHFLLLYTVWKTQNYPNLGEEEVVRGRR